MDTSETYIKMRRKAISDMGMGTTIECPCSYIMNDVWVDSKGDWYYSTEVESFQLERQDQLQVMMFAHWNFAFAPRLVSEFSCWLATEGVGKYEELSMEQLWLAFVMRTLYSKIWDGEDWVKAEI